MSKTQRWLVLATVSAGLLMVSVDTTVLYTALPTLTRGLQADVSQKLWIINAYPLVMAGLLPGAGTLGDRVGHKRMYLAGLALFAAASLLAAFAPSPPVLIAARAFLAVGAAAMLPATAALIRITFDDEHERGIAIGVWGTMAVLGAALGPIVGGLLLAHFWWGSVFLLNIPVVLLALAATAAVVPGGSGHRDRPWDLIASLQATVALAGVVYAIQEAAKPGPSPLAIVLALLAAAAGCWMFVRRQRRQAYPLIDFSLFRNPSLLTGVIAAALSMAATVGIDLLLTQRLQLVVGLTPLHAGLIVTAFAAGSLPVGVLAGGLLHRTGPRPLISGGLLLGALGVLVTLLLTPGAVPLLGGGRSPAWVVPGLVLAGAGLGIVMVAASAAIISGAPPQRAGMASSIESVSYELGSLAGITILGTILTAVYTNTIHLPATAPARAAGSIDQARAAAGHLPAGQARTLLAAAASAFDNGYTLALAITAIALAAGSAFTYRYLKRQPATPAEQTRHPEPAPNLPLSTTIRDTRDTGDPWDAREPQRTYERHPHPLLPKSRTPLGAAGSRSKALAVGAAGWIEDLPKLVAGLERDWRITVGRPYEGGTEAFVARATLGDGTLADAPSLTAHPRCSSC
jgi:DHA2 family multidrug resistance protein-like MFS transporter